MEHFQYHGKFNWKAGLERTQPLIIALFQWKISHESFISSCKFSPDGKYVVSGLDVDCGICLIDAENAKTVSYVRGEFAQSPCSVPSAMVTAACHLTDHNFRLLYLVKL